MPRLTRVSADASTAKMYDLWMFDIAALRWMDLTATAIANGPVPGFRQRMTLVAGKGTLHLFSGYGQEELLLNVSIAGEPIGEYLPSSSPPLLHFCTAHLLQGHCEALLA